MGFKSAILMTLALLMSPMANAAVSAHYTCNRLSSGFSASWALTIEDGMMMIENEAFGVSIGMEGLWTPGWIRYNGFQNLMDFMSIRHGTILLDPALVQPGSLPSTSGWLRLVDFDRGTTRLFFCTRP